MKVAIRSPLITLKISKSQIYTFLYFSCDLGRQIFAKEKQKVLRFSFLRKSIRINEERRQFSNPINLSIVYYSIWFFPFGVFYLEISFDHNLGKETSVKKRQFLKNKIPSLLTNGNIEILKTVRKSFKNKDIFRFANLNLNVTYILDILFQPTKNKISIFGILTPQ